MKKLLSYIAVSLALLACAKDPVSPGLREEANIQIGVIVADGAADTKGTVVQRPDSPGEDPYNENYLNTLDFFFYLDGSAEDDGDDYLGNPLPSASAIYHIHKNNVDANTTWTLSDVADRNVLDQIFAGGNRCIVYVIANYSGSSFSGIEKRIELRQKVATSTFNAVDANGDGIPQANGFVMEGYTEIQRTELSGLYYVSGTVPLYRSASKIRLKVTIPDALFEDGTKVKDGNGFEWTPVPEGMKVVLVHGVKKGIVCAFDDTYSYGFTEADNYFALPNESDLLTTYGHKMHFKESSEVSGKTYKSYEHLSPLYSYPTEDWKSNRDNETYLMLVLPWSRETGEQNVNTYYQIPIAVNPNDPEYRLRHNRYYRMEVTIGILGSFELEDKVDLYPSTYIVLDWCLNKDTDPAVSDVNMAQTAFLAVAAHADTLNNVASHGVEYITSHTPTAEFTELEFYSFYDSNTTDRMMRVVYTRNRNAGTLLNTWTRQVFDVATGYEITGNGYNSNNAGNPFTSTGTYKGFPLGGYTIDTADGMLTLSHTIPDSQFSEAKVKVELTNTAIASPEEVTFVQYPAIYITGQRSNGYIFVNGTGNGGNQIVRVYDDRTNTTNGRIGALSPRTGVTGNGTNSNRNLYTIHISSFDSGSSYILGDPRTKEAVTLNNLSGTANKYHPTYSLYTGTYGQDITENMVSPEFLIASSYGAIRSGYYISYDQAKKRCAAYQEAGYPAGRWRMPTKAEVLYMMELSESQKIPSLFYFSGNNDTEGYWCANGKIVTRNGNLQLENNSTVTAVRCVYDTWYWGSEPYQKNATTWLGYQY